MKSSLFLSRAVAVLFAINAAALHAGADYSTPYAFTTLAGTSSIGSADGAGSAARFFSPREIAADAAGNFYVADNGNHTIRKITPAGVVTTFAGSPGKPGAVDGNGSAARFDAPRGLVADATGNLFVADTGNHTIRKVTPAGVVTTLAGSAGLTGSTDGSGSAARFNRPRRLAIDSAGNIYVADAGNRAVRKVTSAGVVTTFATELKFPESSDINALTNVDYGAIAVDSGGNVYVSAYESAATNSYLTDTGYWWYTIYLGFVHRLTPAGGDTRILQTSVYRYYDGRVENAAASALTVDASGQLVVAYGYVIGRLDPNTLNYARIAGDGTIGSADGPAATAKFGTPLAIAYDRNGNLAIADAGNNVVRKLSTTGEVTTVAGLALERATGTIDGTGDTARFVNPTGVAVNATGVVYVADSGAHCIRRITPGGTVTTVAGAPGISGFADGAGAEARFKEPRALALDRDGNVYIADNGNHGIRKISPSGVVSTFGETPQGTVPIALAVDAAANIYFVNISEHAIRKITPGGEVTIYAGDATQSGDTDGPRNEARFTFPTALASSPSGELYVIETSGPAGYSRIRKIAADGSVSTLAGHESGYSDGSQSAARFDAPSAIAVDAAGNLFVADRLNQLIRRISAHGVVTTIAGLVDAAGSTDGIGREARFFFPLGVAVDSAGALYVTNGTALRKGVAASGPAITTQPASQSLTVGASATFNVSASGTAPLTYQWHLNGAAISGATDASFTIPSIRVADAGDYTVVVSNGAGSVTSNKATLTITAAPPTTSGGGGAPSTWFGLATAALAILRRRFVRTLSFQPHANEPQIKRHSIPRSLVLLVLICGTLAEAPFSFAADYYYTHLAGPLGGPGNADGPITRARFNAPNSLAIDAQGNLIVADAGNRTVRKVTPQGIVSTVRPDGQFAIWFSGPSGVAIDTSGTIYVADANQQIFKVAPNGAKSAWAGVTYYPTYDRNREIGEHWDGPISGAHFFRPSAMAFDRTGNLYVADTGNHVIRKITPDGIVSTLAGAPHQSGNADGTGASARFVRPHSIAIDPAGTLYVADFGSIRKITPEGSVTTLAGVADQFGSVDGKGAAARFYRPVIALDGNGTVFVADSGNHTIRRVTPAGEVTTLAGLAGHPENFDGQGAQARFANPSAIVIDARGMLLVADTDNDCIRQVAPDGTVTTFAGAAGGVGRTDGQGAMARFYEPWGLALDDLGNLYVADRRNSLIRKISPSGQVSTFAGGGQMFGAADGPLGTAAFFEPSDVAVDRDRNVYVSDAGNNLIRKVSPDGTVTTLAGRARFFGSQDGPGSEATFAYPLGVAVDSNGTVFVSDAGNRKIRRISPQGIVSTLELRGDCSAFAAPHGIAIDQDGTLFVADRNSHVVHRISPDGTLSIVAGKPFDGGFVDGRGSAARFLGPTDVVIDSAGNLIVADSSNHAVRLITPDGEVSTIGGTPGVYGSADGLTASAHFLMPLGLAIDREDQIYIGEALNNSIRKALKASAPHILTQPRSKSAPVGGSTSLAVEVAAVPTPTFQWFFNGNAISGATGNTLSLSVVTSAEVGDYTVVVSNDLGSVTSNKATLTVTTAPTPSSGGGSSSGGGASSVWSAIAIATLASIRRFR